MTLKMGSLRSHILHNRKSVNKLSDLSSVTVWLRQRTTCRRDLGRHKPCMLSHSGHALLVSCPEAVNVCWFSGPAQLWSLREGPLIGPLESLTWQHLSGRTSIRAPPEMGLRHLDITPLSTLLFVSPLFPNLRTCWGSASPNADYMKVQKRPFPHDALLSAIGKPSSNVLNPSTWLEQHTHVHGAHKLVGQHIAWVLSPLL